MVPTYSVEPTMQAPVVQYFSAKCWVPLVAKLVRSHPKSRGPGTPTIPAPYLNHITRTPLFPAFLCQDSDARPDADSYGLWVEMKWKAARGVTEKIGISDLGERSNASSIPLPSFPAEQGMV